jgi:hypothetical protein
VTSTFSNSQAADVTVAGPLMSIDLPPSGSTVQQPFVASGWAVDLRAVNGIGVDAIHVYAFPVGGGAPVFVGQAATGGVRGDVGALFGSQFTNSGYTLAVAALAPGIYDMGVYAHSTVTGTFNQQQFARVTIAAATSSHPPIARR